jgi:acyl transferase domain-containing protein
MDPMQRMMLETAYRAFENGKSPATSSSKNCLLRTFKAGLPLEKVTGTDTSVFTGCFTTDYLLQLMRDPQYLPTYAATGVAGSLLANRLSWFFDLKGASVNLDSACSSSGMALDWACSQLRDGSCRMVGYYPLWRRRIW